MTPAPYDLRGKGVLVTGASSGIGRALAGQLAAGGARLAIVARRRQRLEQLADEVVASGGRRPVVLTGDLGRRGEAARLAREAVARLGAVDVLVNNAGGGVGGSVWAVADRDEARTDFEVDFWSHLAFIGELVPLMRRRGEGAVVNVTSIRQVMSWPSFGHNTAAKAALASVTETLRLELAPYGVHVVEVIPGPVDTHALGPARLIPGMVDTLQGRLGLAQPEEVAAQVVEAIRHRAERVFAPEATTRGAYEEPFAFRQEVARSVRQGLGTPAAPARPDDLVDTLVVGGDHPLVVQAREDWEASRDAG